MEMMNMNKMRKMMDGTMEKMMSKMKKMMNVGKSKKGKKVKY